MDEKGNYPGFVWQGCQWAWHDFENNRRGVTTSKNQAVALLIESRKSNSLEVLFSPEIQDILENNEGIHDPRLFTKDGFGKEGRPYAVAFKFGSSTSNERSLPSFPFAPLGHIGFGKIVF